MDMSKTKRKQVLDGGVSSTLADASNMGNIHDDILWSSRLLVTEPELVTKVHQWFLESGSDVITTVTYQASVEGFMKGCCCSQEEAKNHIQKGAELAISARDKFWNEKRGSCRQQDKPLVAGSLGPYGVLLCDGSEYSGFYIDKLDDKTIADFYRPRMAALLQGGVDLLAFETIPSLREAQIICQLMNEFPTTRAWLSFSCKDDELTCHGERLTDAVRQTVMQQANVFGVGINCTAPQHITSLLKNLPPDVLDTKTVLVYPNKGEYWDTVNRCFVPGETSVSAFSDSLVKEWIELGAQWLGGCCQTTPSDIKAIAAVLDDLQ